MPVKKILVVDDSPTERQYMLETLQKKGYADRHRRQRRGGDRQVEERATPT